MLLESLAGTQADEQAKPQPVMNEAKFQAFYAETARPLRSYICRVCGNSALSDDILQEAYLRLLRASKLKQEPNLMKAYVYRVATNLITDHWRRTAREARWVPVSHSDPDFQERPAPLDASAEGQLLLRRDLGRVFQQLKPSDRSLLWLAYVEGSEHREIAAILGIREKSIRVLLFRARQKLLRLLKRRGLGLEVKS